MKQQCPHCQSTQTQKKGFFKQKFSKKYIQRFWCLQCKTKFSTSTLSITYKQQKPQFNKTIYLNLCSGMSLRRSAKNLNLSFNTVYSRFLWLAELAKTQQTAFVKSLSDSTEVQVDEMESIEHTKLKPLAIPLVVDQSQRILAISCGVIPAKGPLAEISRKKYGFRASESEELLFRLLQDLPLNIAPQKVKSDGKPMYRKLIQARWKDSKHEVYVRKADKKKEQLYLKSEKRAFDPMFALNQRCAKLRADVNRLIRRSWCTTKKADNLAKHLLIYACYNNQIQLM